MSTNKKKNARKSYPASYKLKLVKLHEEEGARLVAEMEERDKKKLRPSHRGQRLDDGIQSDRRDNIPIEELMKGFRGSL